MPSSGQSHDAATGKWLSIVGIGEDGLAGLGLAARQAIEMAAHVYGGRRHLALAAGAINGNARAWQSPFDTSMSEIRGLRGERVCVLASGDPFLHGVGATLARYISPAEMEVHPAPSAFSLAAARLGWALQDVETISLHGKAVSRIRPHLQPGRRILALTSNADDPASIADLLTTAGLGASRLLLLEALGGANERVSAYTAASFTPDFVNPLNIVALEIAQAHDARVIPLAPGLPESMFGHDGQISKREIRAQTLSALAPRRGELLWDIGAGSGSVAIEWMLRDPAMRAVAIERDPVRAARARENAHAFGVPDLRVVEGVAPDILSGLPQPDAVFIGGGGSQPGTVEAVISALPAGGRLVANAVTLEMERILLDQYHAKGGELLRIALSRAAPIGSMNGWRPAMPLSQWIWEKP